MKLDIQLFASGTISLGTSGALQGQIIWSSVSNGSSANSSTVTCTLQIARTNAYTTTGAFPYQLTMGGSTISGSWYGSITNSWMTIAQNVVTIPHNSDGTGSAYVYGYAKGASGTSLANNSVSGSVYVTLDNIPRYATITNAPNFNDEGNPTVTYTNPAGNAVSTLQMCIASTDGYFVYVPYRDVSKTGSSYTFELTNQERDALRNATPNSNNMQIEFALKTILGGETYYSVSYKTFSIINGNPVFNDFEFEDINSTTLALTGDSSINVAGYSNIQATISTINKAEAIKGATMSKYRLSIGDLSQDITYSNNQEVSGTINNATSGTYNVYAIDSRNNSTLVTKNSSSNIAYEKIYIDAQNTSVNRNDGGTGTACILTLNGKLWNNSFGAVTNSIKSATYQLKKTGDSTYVTGTSTITPTVSNDGTFTATVSLASNNADYSWDLGSSYNVRLTLADELSSSTVDLVLLSAVPNISLADNGVGIMCDYDETIGGDLQIGGVKYEPVEIYKTASVTLEAGTSMAPGYSNIISLTGEHLVTISTRFQKRASTSNAYTKIATLPVGYRPPYLTLFTYVNENGTVLFCYIDASGGLYAFVVDTSKTLYSITISYNV